MKSPGTIIATIALVVALGGNAVVYKINADQQGAVATAKAAALDSHQALCGLHENLKGDIADQEARIESTQKIIDDHPNGFLGYSPAQLKQAKADQEATLERQKQNYAALSAADC
jgi:hypothetical protein